MTSQPLRRNGRAEKWRIEALDELAIAVDQPELAFQRLVDMAAEITETPSAILSFVGRDTVWIKAAHHFSLAGVPRELSFCGEAIGEGDICVVPDAMEDERFRAFPSVTAERGIRFYAGAPIVTGEGHRIGILAVLDHSPREGLSPSHRRLLRQLADIAMDELELRAMRHRLDVKVASLQQSAVESRRRERELIAAKLEADAARAAKQRFLSHMSHELRTPLHGIRGMTALLAESTLTAEQRSLAQVIDERAASLLDIVGDVLDMAKLDAGQVTIASRPYSPADVLLNGLMLVNSTAAQKQLELRADVGPDLPGQVMGDEVRVQQVLVNLLGNAVKFTRQGSVTARVFMRSRMLRFEVVDTGPGIPPHFTKLIFDPFQQIGGPHLQAQPGTGLGLTICREFVALMGGGLFVHGNESGGSTFAFELPAATVSAADEKGNLLRGTSLLLIAPKSAAARRAAAALLGQSARVTQATSLEEALSQGNERLGTYDAVLLSQRSAGDALDEAGGLLAHPNLLLCWENLPPADGRMISPVSAAWPMWHPRFASAVAARLTPRNRLEPPSVRQLAGLSVLLAEDDATSASIVIKTLERSGANVMHTPDGRAAAEIAVSRHFHALLLDMNLPGLTGRQILQEVRRGQGPYSNTPAFALTASANAVSAAQITEAGFAGVLFKPFAPDALREMLASLVGRQTGENAGAIDQSMVTALSDLLGYEAFKKTIHQWESNMDGQITALHMAMAEETFPSHILHKMKGTAGSVGASRLAALIEEAEQAGRVDVDALEGCLKCSAIALHSWRPNSS